MEKGKIFCFCWPIGRTFLSFYVLIIILTDIYQTVEKYRNLLQEKAKISSLNIKVADWRFPELVAFPVPSSVLVLVTFFFITFLSLLGTGQRNLQEIYETYSSVHFKTLKILPPQRQT